MNSYARSGIFAGLIIVAFRLAIFYSGSLYTPIGRYANLIDFVIMLPAIFWGIKSKKERDLKQNYILKEAIKTGLQIVVAISLTLAFFMFIFFSFETPAILAQTQNYLIALDTPAAKIPAILANASAYFSPFHQATIALFIHLILGAVMALLCATILGQKK